MQNPKYVQADKLLQLLDQAEKDIRENNTQCAFKFLHGFKHKIPVTSQLHKINTL